MKTEAAKNVVNGVNVHDLFESIDAMKKSPVLAKFRFRVNNKWLEGGYNRTTVTDFHGTCEDHPHKQPFTIDADEPPLLLGQDRGANPVEYLLAGLAGCVTSSMIYHAAAKGIHIQEVESRLEGDIDLQGFLGLDENVPKGYESIRMKFKIKADCSDEQLEELCKLGPTYSPVFDTVTRAVPVTVELDK
ncbi:MAG: OsmC family protein [Planctomycetota bacterium]|jgi:uncharacterized OsmC-like protein